MRQKKLVKDIVPGDVLLLDLDHMNEQPHVVIALSQSAPLFMSDTDTSAFDVDCCGERFTTFRMSNESQVDVEVST